MDHHYWNRYWSGQLYNILFRSSVLSFPTLSMLTLLIHKPELLDRQYGIHISCSLIVISSEVCCNLVDVCLCCCCLLSNQSKVMAFYALSSLNFVTGCRVLP